MRKLFFSLGVACASMLMVSCSSSKKAMNTAILNGEWNIVEVEGNQIAASGQQKTPVIGFDLAQKRIYGNSGCNRMMGTFEADSLNPGKLKFGPIAGTRMACPDMNVEKNVLAALEKVQAFDVLSCAKDGAASCKVALNDANGKQVLVIEKKETAEEKAADLSVLGGEWTIVTVNSEPLKKTEKEAFLGFNLEDKRVFGTAGCNNINGAIKQEEGKAESLILGPVAATMMMCPDMENERKVLAALNVVKSFGVLADGKVALCDSEGKEVMLLQKK